STARCPLPSRARTRRSSARRRPSCALSANPIPTRARASSTPTSTSVARSARRQEPSDEDLSQGGGTEHPAPAGAREGAGHGGAAPPDCLPQPQSHLRAGGGRRGGAYAGVGRQSLPRLPEPGQVGGQRGRGQDRGRAGGTEGQGQRDRPGRIRPRRLSVPRAGQGPGRGGPCRRGGFLTAKRGRLVGWGGRKRESAG